MEDKELGQQQLGALIERIRSNGESGMLQIGAAGNRGGLFFSNGKLVDAQLGSLSGFQAVNAVVSLPDAHFTFDPSISPPASSSISANERIILKRFFGFDTVEVDESGLTAGGEEVDWDLKPEPVVPLSEVPEFSEPEEYPPVEVPLDPRGLSETPLDLSSAASQEGPASIINSHVRSKRRFSILTRPRAAVSLALLSCFVIAAIALVPRLIRRQQVTPNANQVDSQANVSPAPVTTEGSRVEDMTAQNLTGEWNIVNTVDRSRYKPFDNLQIGFRLVINQNGKELTATGEKVSENGRSLPASSRTPIRVTGSVNGDEVLATFVEEGASRRSSGNFVWKIQNDGAGLNGTFVSTAAKSSGRSAATKQP